MQELATVSWAQEMHDFLLLGTQPILVICLMQYVLCIVLKITTYSLKPQQPYKKGLPAHSLGGHHLNYGVTSACFLNKLFYFCSTDHFACGPYGSDLLSLELTNNVPQMHNYFMPLTSVGLYKVEGIKSK